MPIKVSKSLMDGIRSEVAPREADVAAHGPKADFTEAQIRETFDHFDTDESGDLDYFELSNALAELLSTPPSTPKMMSLIKASGNESTSNRLSLAEFTAMLRSPVWSAPDPGLPASMYEVVFADDKLGLSVRSVVEKGLVVVLAVVDQRLIGVVNLNDTVTAVNGAPMGYVTDHKAR